MAMTFTVQGGPYIGYSAKQTELDYFSNEQVYTRTVLRNVWNGQNAQASINGHGRILSPFRAVYNAGDYLGRQNYVCGGPNGSPGGSMISHCDSTGVAAGSGNSKFVYDSSDYVRFKKEQATNRTYNDAKH